MSSSTQLNLSNSSAPTGNVTMTQFEGDMEALMVALNQTLQSFAENQSDQLEVDSKINDMNFQNTIHNIVKNDKQLVKRSKAGFWKHLLQDICIVAVVVVMAVSVASGNVEFAALSGGLLVADKLHAFKEIGKGIGELISPMLQGLGVPKDKADEIGQILGDAISVVAATVAGTMLGSTAPEAEALEDAAEVRGASKKAKAFGGIAGTNAGMQVSSDFNTNLVELFAGHGKKAKDIANLMTLVTDLVLAVAGIGAGVAAVQTTNIVSDFGRNVSNAVGALRQGLSRMLPEVMNYLSENGPSIKEFGQVVDLYARTTNGVAKLYTGVTDIDLAHIEAQLAKSQEGIDLSSVLSDLVNSSMQRTQKYLDTGVNALESQLSSTQFGGWFEGLAQADIQA